MISGEELIALAATFNVTSGAPFAVSPVEASAQLREPTGFTDSRPRPSVWDADHADPIQFANALDGLDIDSRCVFASGAAPEMAGYTQALDRLIDLDPILLSPYGKGLGHPVSDLDEAALALWSAAWMAGVNAGVAYEHLRLAQVRVVMVCEHCHGHGLLWAGRPYRDDAVERMLCSACDGRGTVPTPTPRI